MLLQIFDNGLAYGYNPFVRNLESLERGTPEFRALTPEQQNARRRNLSLILHLLSDNTSALGLTPEQVSTFAYKYLEFHLTGKIDRVEEMPKKRKK